MAKTLRAMGHGPKVRGGNGKGLSRAEAMLLEAMGPEWSAHHAVRTRMPRGSGYPPCYKLDLAHVQTMVAVEVDGESHSSLARRAQDQKKTDFLNGLGWIVLRVSNRQVTEELSSTISRLKEATRSLRTGS
jgi:hypothetical protein